MHIAFMQGIRYFKYNSKFIIGRHFLHEYMAHMRTVDTLIKMIEMKRITSACNRHNYSTFSAFEWSVLKQFFKITIPRRRKAEQVNKIPFQTCVFVDLISARMDSVNKSQTLFKHFGKNGPTRISISIPDWFFCIKCHLTTVFWSQKIYCTLILEARPY